jgi:hypothetical protein
MSDALLRIDCSFCGTAEDIATTPQLGRELASSIPGAQFCRVENAGISRVSSSRKSWLSG